MFNLIYISRFAFFYTLRALFLKIRLLEYRKRQTYYLEFDFLTFINTNFRYLIILDWISIFFLFTVSSISGSIFLYSTYYIKGEKNYLRFNILMWLFILRMLSVIIRPRIISILLGWDGLGLSSYLLVIYYQRESASRSGILTIISNRIGDVSILMTLRLLHEKNLYRFFSIFEKYPLISFLLLLAAWTKRAQVPFSAWLPAAIAAPTPVSSLVHSSTLVTAGVYLIIRTNNFLVSNILIVGLILSLITNIISGFISIREKDLKKVIALSTLSQVSLMIITVIRGHTYLAFFHLIIHAFFKSALFINVGFVIHRRDSTQDSRNISQITISSPLHINSILISNFSLIGLPFISGFFSKDIILENIFSLTKRAVTAWALIISIFLTIYYSLIIVLILSRAKINKTPLYSFEDNNFFVIIALLPLLTMALAAGYFIYWIFPSLYLCVLYKIEKFFILIVVLFSSISASFWQKKRQLLKKLYNKEDWILRNFFITSFFPSIAGYLLLSKNKNIIISTDSGWLEIREVNKPKNFAYIVSFINQVYQNSDKIKLTLIFIFIMLIIIV